MLLIAGLLIVNGGTACIFVTRDYWYLGYIPVLVGTWAWPAIDLAGVKILMGLAEEKDAKGLASAYVAINAVVIAVAGTLSGLFGGVMAEWLGQWHGSLFTWPITYHGILLLISAALRLLALGWVLAMTEPSAKSTHEAFRYLVANLYSNLNQGWLTPVRRIFRWDAPADEPSE